MTLPDLRFWCHLRLALFHRRRWLAHRAALIRLALHQHRPGCSSRSPAGSDHKD